VCLAAGIGAAFASIHANLGDALGAWVDPLGVGIGDLGDRDAAAAAQEVATATFGVHPQAITWFEAGLGALAERVGRAFMLVTALTPWIGRAPAGRIASTTVAGGHAVIGLARGQNGLLEVELALLLDPLCAACPHKSE